MACHPNIVSRLSRRKILRAAIVTGVAGLAGCGDDGSGDDGESCNPLPEEPNYADWFSDVSNYDYTCDRRGEDLVEVTVGARGNDAFWAFEPAAIAVTPETTVRWQWNGKGGPIMWSRHGVSLIVEKLSRAQITSLNGPLRPLASFDMSASHTSPQV